MHLFQINRRTSLWWTFLSFGLRWSRHVAGLCLFLTGCVCGELLGVKCWYNLEPHCQDVNGLWDYSGSLVYIRLLLVRSIQWLEWNKINPEIERTPNLLSHGGGGVWCAVQCCIANTHPAPEREISRAAFHPHFSLQHKVRSSWQERLHWKMQEKRAHSDLLHETFPWNLIRETATGRSEFPSPPQPSAVWAVTGHPIFNTLRPSAVRNRCCDTHPESKIYCKKVQHTPVRTLTALFSSTLSFI